MLDQLKELLEMQRVLDENILKAKGITEYPLENMKIALFVELGELMNEFPTKFKHWKSSAVDNREKGLEEYVDCLHFALSITNAKVTLAKYEHYFREYEKTSTWLEDTFELLDDVLYDLSEEYYADLLDDLFRVGNYLGFTWEEIYEAYKKKNAVNYERLKNGY